MRGDLQINYALRWKLIDQNPFSGVKQLPILDKAPAYFQRDDFEKHGGSQNHSIKSTLSTASVCDNCWQLLADSPITNTWICIQGTDF